MGHDMRIKADWKMAGNELFCSSRECGGGKFIRSVGIKLPIDFRAHHPFQKANGLASDLERQCLADCIIRVSRN